MNRVKQGVINIFSGKKSNAGDSYRGNMEQDIMPSNEKVQAIHFNEKDPGTPI